MSVETTMHVFPTLLFHTTQAISFLTQVAMALLELPKDTCSLIPDSASISIIAISPIVL